MRGQKVLPRSTCLLQLILLQTAVAQTVAGLDHQRTVGMLRNELLKPFDGFVGFIQLLMAAGHQQLDFDLFLWFWPHFQSLAVELKGLGVIWLQFDRDKLAWQDRLDASEAEVKAEFLRLTFHIARPVPPAILRIQEITQ